jgi:hypothetical protein
MLILMKCTKEEAAVVERAETRDMHTQTRQLDTTPQTNMENGIDRASTYIFLPALRPCIINATTKRSTMGHWFLRKRLVCLHQKKERKYAISPTIE